MKKPRLTDSDRLAIETGLKSGKTVYMIAKELSRPVTTVTRERVARSIYAMTGSSRPYAASNATCLRSFTRQLCSSSSRPDL